MIFTYIHAGIYIYNHGGIYIYNHGGIHLDIQCELTSRSMDECIHI